MRKHIGFFLVFIFALVFANVSFDSSKLNIPFDSLKLVSAKVVKVIDGDTIDVLINNQTVRVRLIGVDTPEITGGKNEYYGQEAYLYTMNTLTNRQIWLELDVLQYDKYNRLLAYIWITKPETIKQDSSEYVNESEIRSKMFNAILLLDGFAQVMTVPPNVKYSELFRKFESEARQKEKGLWKPQPQSQTKSTEQTYQSSQSTSQSQTIYVYITPTGKKYHLANCRTIKGESTRITLEEAKKRGYEPCGVCNPPR